MVLWILYGRAVTLCYLLTMTELKHVLAWHGFICSSAWEDREAGGHHLLPAQGWSGKRYGTRWLLGSLEGDPPGWLGDLQLRLKEQETLGASSPGSLPFSVSSVPEGREMPPEHGVWRGPAAGGGRLCLDGRGWTLTHPTQHHQHSAKHVSLK